MKVLSISLKNLPLKHDSYIVNKLSNELAIFRKYGLKSLGLQARYNAFVFLIIETFDFLEKSLLLPTYTHAYLRLDLCVKY